MTDITIAFGGDEPTDVDTRFINPLHLDPRVGFKIFLGSADSGYHANRLAAMGAYRAKGHAIQFTYDLWPAQTQWATNPQQAVTMYSGVMVPFYQSMLAGQLDAKIDAAANNIIAGGCSYPDVSMIIDHECMAGFWYIGSACTAPSLWVAAMKYKIRRLRSKGVKCRIGIDFGNNALVNADLLVDPELASLIDSVSTDPYKTHDAIYPPPVDEMMHCITWAETHGKLVDLPEIGGVGHAVDTEMLPYIRLIRDRIIAHPCVASVSFFVTQPEDTTYKPDGSVQYYGSGACDPLTQTPRPFPTTFPEIRDSFIPKVLAVKATTTPPVPPVPPTGDPVTFSIAFPDAIPTPDLTDDPHAGVVMNQNGSVKIKVTGDGFTKLDFWRSQNRGLAGSITAAQLNNGEATITLTADLYYPVANGPVYPQYTPLMVQIGTPPVPPTTPDDVAALKARIAELEAQNLQLKAGLDLANMKIVNAQHALA